MKCITGRKKEVIFCVGRPTKICQPWYTPSRMLRYPFLHVRTWPYMVRKVMTLWTSNNNFSSSPSPSTVWLITLQDLLLNDTVLGVYSYWSFYRHEWQVRSNDASLEGACLAISGEFMRGTTGIIPFFELYSLTVVFRYSFTLTDANTNEMMNLSTGAASPC